MKHGTDAAYKVHACRCPACTEAHRLYARNRHRQMAYGQWEPYIDAGPVRAHVEALRAAGLGWKRVAALAGLSSSTVWKLLWGDSRRNMAPSKRVRRETAAKLLAVQAGLDVLGATVAVDATSTVRRLRALVAIGWSQSRIAGRIGMLPGNFSRVIHHAESVQAVTARAVRDLYDELWATAPPQSEWRDKIAANRARNYAAARGWAPPMAWDDDTIDDPDAEPAGTGQPGGPRGKLPVDSELLWLAEDCGQTLDALAQRFGVKPASVRTALHRARSESEMEASACLITIVPTG